MNGVYLQKHYLLTRSLAKMNSAACFPDSPEGVNNVFSGLAFFMNMLHHGLEAPLLGFLSGTCNSPALV